MKRYLIRSLLAFILVVAASCSKENVLGELEHIKAVGDESPQKALLMLDSLEMDIRECNEYVRAKYDLLRIRLNDKADNMPVSDIVIRKLIEYFKREGSAAEKQEVYYYAGSVYRDLQDTPRALEHFFRSLDYAADNRGCDSVMLRNTYSNLTYLYYAVQNYKDAVDMAHKELDVSKRIGADEIVSYMHLGSSYHALDSARQAESAYDSAFSRIARKKDVPSCQRTVIRLLCGYSELGKAAKARECLALIEGDPLEDYSAFPCMAFAQYYESVGKHDSAAIYCKRILDDGTDIYNMYDAAKLLFRMYNRAGDMQGASRYAEVYMQLSDSLDFGKRQELAATVNNAYKYHLDQRREQSLKDERERYRNILVIVSLAAILLLSLGYILHVRRRNRHLQEVVTLSSELQRVSDDDKQLRAGIAKKEQDLEQSKKSLAEASDELANVRLELQRVNAELAEYEEAIKTKELQLSERMAQNKTFIKLLHQSDLEGKAEDVIYAVRQSSTGKKDMKPADWKQLYQAVDELYPRFRDRLLKELGTFTEQQMQVCYLMRIGLSKPQIQNMTGLARVTVWRWVKKYDWVLAP